MRILVTIGSLLLLLAGRVQAQSADMLVKKGNELYKKGDYTGAGKQYEKALDKDARNNKARFNLGNALQQEKHWADAEKAYDQVAGGADTSLRANAYYNKGLAFAREKKFPEAVDAFKQSLRFSPADDDTRENLQKAINEMKQQQQQQQPQQNPNQKPPKNQKNNPQKQPQQNNSKLNQQQAEQLLNNLRENEKQLQRQLQKQRTPLTQTDKDW